MDNVIIWGSGGGPHAVRTHGTLLTFADNPTDIDLFIVDSLVRVRFEFPYDGKMLRIEYSTAPGIPGSKTEPATIVLRIVNLRGEAVSDGPIRFATVAPFGLWLVYEVSAAAGSKKVKKIHYTVWDGSIGDKANYSSESDDVEVERG